MIIDAIGIVLLILFVMITISHWEKAFRWWIQKKESSPFLPFVGGLVGLTGGVLCSFVPLWVSLVLPFTDIGFVVSICGVPRLFSIFIQEMQAVYTVKIFDGSIVVFRNEERIQSMNVSDVWRVEQRRGKIILHAGPPSCALLSIPSKSVDVNELKRILNKPIGEDRLKG